MVNYAVDPSCLHKFIPYRTELDLWNGTCYVSLVGFMFLNTRVLGIPVPYHVNFEEVNLRFYVRYQCPGESRRGVVFIRELVPRWALAVTANALYYEHYEAVPMSHRWQSGDSRQIVEYRWKKNVWNSISVDAQVEGRLAEPGSEQEFITEHYWGYTRISHNRTWEYKVEHPSWKIHDVISHDIQIDFQATYGEPFSFLQDQRPTSVFLADGSPITVRRPSRIA